ncbi:MAG TPA: HNH endonuclease signature motif containing protein [Phycisphaerae bacterium]|nr:HNH endonuclease signature motif containing protein [Phycisphaerae bacterium]
MSGYVPPALRSLVADRAEYLCEYCLIHERDTFLGCQIEHIISEKHGGETTADNLAFACVFCNRFKGSDIATISPRTQALCRLFNPRTDHWSEHFRIDNDYIIGLTDIGESTAFLLGFNQPDRLLERQALIKSRLYPSAAASKRLEPR